MAAYSFIEIQKYGLDVPLATKGDRFCHTPLHYAAESKSLECIEVLLEYGADPECVAAKNRSVLNILLDNKDNEDPSAEEKCIPIVNLLIAKKTEIEARDNDEQTLLHVAAKYKMTKIIEILLPLLPKYIDNVDVYGNTVLHRLIAAIKNEDGEEEMKYIETVILLLKNCPALVSMRNKKGQNAVHLAVQNKQKAILKILLACDKIHKRKY